MTFIATTLHVVLGLQLAALSAGPAPPSLSPEPVQPEKTIVSFRLAVQVGVPAPRPLAGKITIRPHLASGEEHTLEVSGDRTLSVPLAAGRQWLLEPQVEGYWGHLEILNLRPGETARDHTIRLWPVGRLKGSLRLPDRREKLPAKLSVQIAPPPHVKKDSNVPWGKVTCPVDVKGAFQCLLPADQLDLTVRVEGFVPFYRWQYRIEANRDQDLGVLRLERGASVAGWVRAEGEGFASSGCTVALEPQIPRGGGGETAARLRETVVSTHPDDKGFFQLKGVRPGAFGLRASHPGFAEARHDAVTLAEGSEIVLPEPLTLRLPLDLEISIAPPLDWLGRPWRVRVGREERVDAEAEGEGHFRARDQSPGRYRLEVFDSLGARFYSEDAWEVANQETAKREVAISLVSIRGTVRLGKEPLPATVWFGGEFGETSSRLEANEDGEFEGVLPKGGRWFVNVQAPKLDVERWLRVEVEPNRKGEAEVELRLPDTELFGRTVDEQGQPLPGVRVTLTGGERATDVESKEDGSFRFRGVATGAALLSASYRKASESRFADGGLWDLTDGSSLGPIELRLVRARILKGQVLSSAGPVAGAVILGFAGRPLLAGSAQARSGLDGSFEVQLPAAARTVRLQVSPPGHAFKVVELPVEPEPLTVLVPVEGGVLHLELPGEAAMTARNLVLVLSVDGVPFASSAVMQWALHQGSSLAALRERQAIPQLAPGTYRACLATRAELAVWTVSGELGEPGRCVAGQLEAGGTLTLDLSER